MFSVAGARYLSMGWHCYVWRAIADSKPGWNTRIVRRARAARWRPLWIWIASNLKEFGRKFMQLQEYGKPLAFEAAFWSLGVKDPAYPLDDLGRLSLHLSGTFRAIAIMVLLVKGDTDRFSHNLIRSGI